MNLRSVSDAHHHNQQMVNGLCLMTLCWMTGNPPDYSLTIYSLINSNSLTHLRVEDFSLSRSSRTINQSRASYGTAMKGHFHFYKVWPTPPTDSQPAMVEQQEESFFICSLKRCRTLWFRGKSVCQFSAEGALIKAKPESTPLTFSKTSQWCQTMLSVYDLIVWSRKLSITQSSQEPSVFVCVQC